MHAEGAAPYDGAMGAPRTTAGPAFAVALALAGPLAGSCADSQSAAPTVAVVAAPAPLQANAGSGAGPTAPPVAWALMTRPERREYMRAVVFPKTKELFAAFDPARYGRMTCVTCHGDGVEDGTFTMPNPKLPRLPSSPEGFKQLIAAKPAACQFMLTRLKPAMAGLLGMQAIDPETPVGFGCGNCHQK